MSTEVAHTALQVNTKPPAFTIQGLKTFKHDYELCSNSVEAGSETGDCMNSNSFATPLHQYMSMRLIRFGSVLQSAQNCLKGLCTQPLGPVVHVIEPVPHMFPHISMAWNGKTMSVSDVINDRNEMIVIARRPIELECRLMDVFGNDCSPCLMSLNTTQQPHESRFIEFELRAYMTPQFDQAQHENKDWYWTNSDLHINERQCLFQEISILPIESNSYVAASTAASKSDPIEIDQQTGRFKIRKHSRYRLRFRFAICQENTSFTIVIYPIRNTWFETIEDGIYEKAVRFSLTAVCPQVVLRARFASDSKSSLLKGDRIPSRKRTIIHLKTNTIPVQTEQDHLKTFNNSWPISHHFLLMHLSRIEILKSSLYHIVSRRCESPITPQDVVLIPLHNDKWIQSAIECGTNKVPGIPTNQIICFEFGLGYTYQNQVYSLSNQALQDMDEYDNLGSLCSLPFEVFAEQTNSYNESTEIHSTCSVVSRSNLCSNICSKHFFRIMPDGLGRIRFTLPKSIAYVTSGTKLRLFHITVRPLLQHNLKQFPNLMWKSQDFVAVTNVKKTYETHVII